MIDERPAAFVTAPLIKNLGGFPELPERTRSYGRQQKMSGRGVRSN
jgi:hypothetical protein